MQADWEHIQNVVRTVLLAHNIHRASLYGSRARGDHSPESDLDIVIECPESFSLYDLVKLQHELSTTLNLEAHLTTYRSLHPHIQADVLKDEVRLFE